MTTATINGNTYSDDGTSAKDMLNGGHRTHFLPMVGDVATVAGVVAGQAAQTAIDAANATNGALATKGTSTTSLAVSAGSKSITTQSGKQFTTGNYVTISRTSAPTTLMHGVVTAYSGTALTVDVSSIAGSGTFTDWAIALSGAQGVQGPSGNGVMPYSAKTGAYTIVTTDRGSLIDCTSGTFTLAFQACATLGADWSCYIRNSGTGVITLDPNSAETVDGVATFALNPGSTAVVQCDGSTLRKAGLYQHSSQSIHVQDQKASGTSGTAWALGFQSATLNTVVTNTVNGASLSANLVTLPPGIYNVTASSRSHSSQIRAHVYNNTASSYLLTGVTSNAYNPSLCFGQINLAVASDISVRVYADLAGAPPATSTGQIEVYTSAIFTKVP